MTVCANTELAAILDFRAPYHEQGVQGEHVILLGSYSESDLNPFIFYFKGGAVLNRTYQAKVCTHKQV